MSREHVIGDPSDFPPGTHRVVNVGRREIGVFNIDQALRPPQRLRTRRVRCARASPHLGPSSPGARTTGSSSG